MSTVLRWTGLPQLISFYRYLAFNGPRVTTALGVVVLLGVAAVRLYWLVGGFPTPGYPVYLAVYFALLVVAALLACVGLIAGRRPGVTKAGWVLGSLASAASLAMYVVSRAGGLPGLPQLVGRWDYPLGTFAVALAALFVGLHFSVLSGMNVAYPHRRDWHD